MKKLKAMLSVPMAVVVSVGAACFTAILLWAPESSKDILFGANGLVFSLVSYFLRSPAQRAE